MLFSITHPQQLAMQLAMQSVQYILYNPERGTIAFTTNKYVERIISQN